VSVFLFKDKIMEHTLQQKTALSILAITEEEITPAIVKKSYRLACKKYHPDINPAGLEMMKMVSLAYGLLKDFEGNIQQDSPYQDFGDDINQAINAIVDLGLTIEVCGFWVWVSGDTKPHKEKLKGSGFKWAPKKKHWYFRTGDYKSFSRGTYSMDEN
jgi:curved DNA-binding protein CbpA